MPVSNPFGLLSLEFYTQSHPDLYLNFLFQTFDELDSIKDKVAELEEIRQLMAEEDEL
jgi:hypothetical protein